jgi:hypothetical protein
MVGNTILVPKCSDRGSRGMLTDLVAPCGSAASVVCGRTEIAFNIIFLLILKVEWLSLLKVEKALVISEILVFF